jgi:hypothetical protein
MLDTAKPRTAGDVRRQFPAVRQRPVVHGAHQNVDMGRALRKQRRDIRLAVGDHADPRRTLDPARTHRSGQPARTLLLAEGAMVTAGRLAVAALQKLRVQHPQHGAVRRIHGDHRVQIAAPAPRRPRHGRVLDRQHLTPGAGRRTARKGRVHHLAQAHRRVAKKPRDPDLAGPVAPKAPDPHTTSPVRHKPRQKIGPPF